MQSPEHRVGHFRLTRHSRWLQLRLPSGGAVPDGAARVSFRSYGVQQPAFAGGNHRQPGTPASAAVAGGPGDSRQELDDFAEADGQAGAADHDDPTGGDEGGSVNGKAGTTVTASGFQNDSTVDVFDSSTPPKKVAAGLTISNVTAATFQVTLQATPPLPAGVYQL